MISIKEIGLENYEKLIMRLIDFIDKSPFYDRYMEKQFAKTNEVKN